MAEGKSNHSVPESELQTPQIVSPGQQLERNLMPKGIQQGFTYRMLLRGGEIYASVLKLKTMKIWQDFF